MQTAKNAAAAAKEAAANVGASAKSGMDKTKATLQEKAEKMTAQHPAEKEMAEQTKEQKIHEAELNKRHAMEQNAMAKEQVRAGGQAGLTAGQPGLTAGHQTRTAASPVPGQGHVMEGKVGSHPVGTATGTGRPAAARNPYVEGTEPALRGTGGTGGGYT